MRAASLSEPSTADTDGVSASTPGVLVPEVRSAATNRWLEALGAETTNSEPSVRTAETIRRPKARTAVGLEARVPEPVSADRS